MEPLEPLPTAPSPPAPDTTTTPPRVAAVMARGRELRRRRAVLSAASPVLVVIGLLAAVGLVHSRRTGRPEVAAPAVVTAPSTVPADGRIASGTVAGRPWYAFVSADATDAKIEVNQPVVNGPLAYETEGFSLSHAPGRPLSVSASAGEDTDSTIIVGSFAHGAAVLVRGDVDGRPFTAPLVDVGPAFTLAGVDQAGVGRDVFVVVLDGQLKVERTHVKAYDAASNEVGSFR